jgi:RNA polymerase sigma-70 factor (ECF subfamily)
MSDPDGWVEAHGDILFRYALARLGDATAAEDVVQEALVAALQAREGFRGESAERTWLIGILRHKLADHLRRRCRELPLSADEEGDAVVDHLFAADGHWRKPPLAWDADPAALEDRREFWEVFTRCRDALPARQAALFTLRTLEEADPEDLCQEFSVSATNLWVLLHRARTRLRACLEEHWFGARPA